MNSNLMEKEEVKIIENKKENKNFIEEIVSPIMDSIEKIFDKHTTYSKLKLSYLEKQNKRISWMIIFLLIMVIFLSILGKINETSLIGLLSLIVGYLFGAFSNSSPNQINQNNQNFN